MSISVCGWVRSKRESKGIAFIALNDGSTQDTLQLVVPSESEAFSSLTRCNTGAAVRVTGTLKESPGKGQAFEVEVSSIEVLGDADAEKYPLQKKGHSLEIFVDPVTALERIREVDFDVVIADLTADLKAKGKIQSG